MTQKLSRHCVILAAALSLGGFASSLSAQSVSTAPVGAVTKQVVVGLNSVALTLLNPDLATANATANTATTITLSGVTDVGALLTAGMPYYIEAVNGALEGERFDIDTTTTKATSGSIVTLAVSANNTFALAANNAVGSQFTIRKHITLAQIQSLCSPALVGATASGSADQIWLLNSSGTDFNKYFLRTDGAWRATVGSTADVRNSIIVPPGTGFLISKRTAATTLTLTGGVRVNDFSMPMAAGLSFRAPAYPLSYSPAALGGTVANQWTGATGSANADQLWVLNSAGTDFVKYFMRTDNAWRLTVGSTADQKNNLLFAYDSGFVVSRKVADANYILVSPIAL